MAVRIVLKNSSAEDKRPTPAQLENGEIALNYNEAGAFLTCKDTDGNIQQVGGVKISETAPDSPVKQTLWFQPSSFTLAVYDGDSFLPIAGGGDGGGGTPGGGITSIVGDEGIEATNNNGLVTLDVDLHGGDDGLEIRDSKLKASVASASQLGSVKIGDGIDVDSTGTISVDIPQALNFKGPVDLNNPPAGQINPNPPEVGDTYVNSATANPVDNGWTGIGGESSQAGDLVVWDGNEWEIIGTGGTPDVDLGYTAAPNNGTVTNTAGDDAVIPIADDTNAGLFTAAEKAKLEGIEEGAIAEVNLGYTPAVDEGTVTNDAGTDAVIPIADGTNAGLFTAAEKTKLEGIEDGANVGMTSVDLGYTPAVDQGTVTNDAGNDAVIPLADGTNAGLFTAAEKTKLDGIEAGATNEGTNDGRYLRTDDQAGDQTVQSTGTTTFDGLTEHGNGVRVTGGVASKVLSGFTFNNGQLVASTRSHGAQACGLKCVQQGDGQDSPIASSLQIDRGGANGSLRPDYRGIFIENMKTNIPGDKVYGIYSEIGTDIGANSNIFVAGTAPNFFAGNTFIGGSSSRNTRELWESTLTEEQKEQLASGTLAIPANVSTPGDGSFVRQWWYDQQSAEDQALIDAGELEYPEHFQAANFVDTFDLGVTTNINLLSDGAAYFKGNVTGGGTDETAPQWTIAADGTTTGITVTRAAVVTDEQAGTVETLLDIITDLRARVEALEAAATA